MYLYAEKKETPGPPRGSVRKATRARQDGVIVQLGVPNAPFPSEPHFQAPSPLRRPRLASPAHSRWEGFRIIHDQSESVSGPDDEGFMHMSYWAELDLLDVFSSHVQCHYPLFRRQDLVQQYATGRVRPRLLSAIIAVSTSFSNHPEVLAFGARALSDHYAEFARREFLPILLSETAADLDDLRALFLLTLHDFRRSTSRKTCGNMSLLVRLSYQLGLHQIDNPANCSFYRAGVTTPDEIQSWRYLWWSIFLLDICCTMIAAIPSNIDMDSVCVALPFGTVEDWISGKEIPQSTNLLFFQSDLATIRHILHSASDSWMKQLDDVPEIDGNFILRLLNAYQLREVGNLRRATIENPHGDFSPRLDSFLTRLTVLRAALPAAYRDPVFQPHLDKSRRDHALRLINLFGSSFLQLLLLMPKRDEQEDLSLTQWSGLESVLERTVQVVRNWDPSFCSITDPAVGCTVFTAMTMLLVHSKLETNQAKTKMSNSKFESSWNLLKMFLQHLGRFWTLPQILLESVEELHQAMNSSLSLRDACHILESLQRPITFRPSLAIEDIGPSEIQDLGGENEALYSLYLFPDNT